MQPQDESAVHTAIPMDPDWLRFDRTGLQQRLVALACMAALPLQVEDERRSAYDELLLEDLHAAVRTTALPSWKRWRGRPSDGLQRGADAVEARTIASRVEDGRRSFLIATEPDPYAWGAA